MKTLLERIVVNFLRKPKEPPVAPKKTLLERIAVEFLGEAETEKKDAHPWRTAARKAGLKAIRGSRGMWSQDGKWPATGTTRGEKFRLIKSKDKEDVADDDAERAAADVRRIVGPDAGPQADEPEEKEYKPSAEQIKIQEKRNAYISSVAHLFIAARTDESGTGRFRLSPEDVEIYQEHLAKSPEQLLREQSEREKERIDKYGEITDEDVDMVLQIVREELGTPAYNAFRSKLRGKGAPPPKNQQGEAGKERILSVIKHYLQVGGVSSITGEVISFSDSQLDHIISLDNGGADGPENWEWMESRFNQFKGRLTKEKVVEKLEAEGMQSDEEWLLQAKADALKKFEKVSTVAYWASLFENEDEDGNPDIDNLSEEKIKNMKGKELGYLAKAWSAYVGSGDPRYIARFGQTKYEYAPGKFSDVSRGISSTGGGAMKPVKNEPESYGVSTNDRGLSYTEPKWEDDPDGYEKSLDAYNSSRSSGGKAITRDDIKQMALTKITGLLSDSEQKEIDDAVVGSLTWIEASVEDKKRTIKQLKAVIKDRGTGKGIEPEPVSDSIRPLLRSLIIRELDRIKNGN